MRNVFLCLFVLTGLLGADVADAAKCKTAWCRWYQDTGIAEQFGSVEWPDIQFPGYDDFGYKDMLLDSSNSMIVARYVRMPDVRTLALKRDYDLQQLDWVLMGERRQQLQREGRSWSKKISKFWKKKKMVGDVMDVIYEIRSVDGLPVWRVHVRPLTFAFGADESTLKYLHWNFSGPQNLVLELPNLANTLAGEVRTSEWQFCESCVADGSATNNRNARFFIDTQARAREEKIMPPITTFDFLPTRIKLDNSAPISVALVTGDAALAAAADVSRRHHEAEAVRLAEERRVAALAERYKAERAAYENLRARIDDDGLPALREARCGELKLNGPPDGDWVGARVDHFEDGMRTNASHYRDHMSCVTRLIDEYDYDSRAAQLADYKRDLNMLFLAANYEDREITTVPRVSAEVDTLSAYLRQQEQRLEDVNRAYDRQWDVMVRAMEHRREERIAQEVDRCMAGLYATQSLTPNSRSYCRSMAEKGYTGMSAAVAGFRGNSSSSNGGNLTYQKSAMPTFDLGGMIANAKAVAEGADSSVLWDESGTIRTTRNPDLPVNATRDRPSVERPTAEPVASPPSVERAQNPDAAKPDNAGESTSVPQQVADNDAANASDATAEQMRALDEGGVRSDDGVRIDSPSTTGSMGSASSGSARTPSGASAPEMQQRQKKFTKYVWVEDIFFEERGFAFSSRESAIRNLQQTWARNRLSRYCADTYDGADGHQGVMVVDEIHVEQIASTRWVGSATLDGYCRVHAHDKSYDEISMCVSERRGQPNCAVREQY